MYHALVDGKTVEINIEKETLFVNGKPFVWDLAAQDNGHFHILYNNKGFHAEVVKVDRATKTVELKINGRNYPVQLRDKFDLLLEKMGLQGGAAAKLNVVKAPMPGLIIDLRVKVGDVVKPGDPLLVLEAMKMENIIKAHGEGTVKQVKIKKGDSVEKNQLLIEF
jgi:biotin carboxyl carrier protein